MDGKQANLGIRSEFDYLPMTNREDSEELELKEFINKP